MISRHFIPLFTVAGNTFHTSFSQVHITTALQCAVCFSAGRRGAGYDCRRGRGCSPTTFWQCVSVDDVLFRHCNGQVVLDSPWNKKMRCDLRPQYFQLTIKLWGGGLSVMSESHKNYRILWIYLNSVVFQLHGTYISCWLTSVWLRPIYTGKNNEA